jgi:hypothetical protein
MSALRYFLQSNPWTQHTYVQHSQPQLGIQRTVFVACPITGTVLNVQPLAPITTIAAPTTVIQMEPTQMVALQLIACTYGQPYYTSQQYSCCVMAGDSIYAISVTSDMQWVQLHGTNTWIPRSWVK